MSEPRLALPQPLLRPGKLCSLQQCGRAVGKQVRRELLYRVHTGNILYARRLTQSRTVIVLRYGGEELAFIYDGANKRILCFLPPGAPETGDWHRSQAAVRARFACAQGSLS